MNIIYGGGAKKPSVKPVIDPGQLVNKVGNFLYNHLDGAYKFSKKANEYDVYVNVIYQIPPEILDKYGITDPKYAELKEMQIDLNITTYQNKIRVNTITITPEEETVGFDLFPPEKLQDLNDALQLIRDKVTRRLEKRFEDYVFIF